MTDASLWDLIKPIEPGMRRVGIWPERVGLALNYDPKRGWRYGKSSLYLTHTDDAANAVESALLRWSILNHYQLSAGVPGRFDIAKPFAAFCGYRSPLEALVRVFSYEEGGE